MPMMEVEIIQEVLHALFARTISSFKDRLTSLNLILPINYWLVHEFLDLLFVFKCKLGYINICIGNSVKTVSFCTGSLRRCASGIFLNNVYAKTSLFRDTFFVRISNLWNALPSDLKSESNVNVFKKFKTFYFTHIKCIYNQHLQQISLKAQLASSASNTTRNRLCCIRHVPAVNAYLL